MSLSGWHRCHSQKRWVLRYFAVSEVICLVTAVELMYFVNSSRCRAMSPFRHFQKYSFNGNARFSKPSTAHTALPPIA